MSLLFNMLSRLVIIILPRSKRLLISWLQSPSAVILEPQKIKSNAVSTVSPSISHEVRLLKRPALDHYHSAATLLTPVYSPGVLPPVRGKNNEN